MKESHAFATVAAELTRQSMQTAQWRTRLASVLPDDQFRTEILGDLEDIQRRFMVASSAAMSGAMRRVSAKNDPDMKCRCASCSDPADEAAVVPAKPEANGHARYMVGEPVEFQYDGAHSWRRATFNGYSADGSGKLLIREHGIDYKVPPENVRWIDKKQPEPAVT